ncbi:MAG TPA: serine protease [Candidatus Acidoferrales bacterium]|nr:serine protease [Candidatus Acidoferrales bacterium]
METNSPGFFCYWTLTFPDSVRPGLWALELQVDGHAVGVQTFQIVANPAVVAAPPTPPPPPSAGDVYQRVVAATVFIESQDAQGELIRRGSGFVIGKGQILTAFQVINGASSLQIEFPDGTRATVNQVLQWNRLQDWAVLQADSSKIQPLERAPAGSWKVGDHGYLLDSPTEMSRTIVNVGVSGVQQSKEFGERLNTSWFGGMRTIGSPLLDDYGRVVGVEGGSVIPGVETLRGPGNEALSVLGQEPQDSFVPFVTPISLIPAYLSTQNPVALSELASRGEFVGPLPRDTQIMSGVLCKDFQKTNGAFLSTEKVSSEFSRDHDMLGIVITWNAHSKIKSTIQFRIYDLTNHAVEQDPPGKIELQPRMITSTGIKMPIAQLAPGTYRVDVMLGDQPQWRGFFRVTE